MKGIRFWEEYKYGIRKGHGAGESTGNCFAVMLDSCGEDDEYGACYKALMPIYQTANSPVWIGIIQVAFLIGTCKRVSEQRARTVHPQLFEVLDKVQLSELLDEEVQS